MKRRLTGSCMSSLRAGNDGLIAKFRKASVQFILLDINNSYFPSVLCIAERLPRYVKRRWLLNKGLTAKTSLFSASRFQAA